MSFVVAPRPKWLKPSLLASMPAELFGKFSPNGKGAEAAKPAPAPPKAKKAAARKPMKKKAPAKPKADKTTLALPKAAPTKPGKRAPTKKERAWMDAIARYGCIACRMDGLGVRPAAVHHMLEGGRRIGHLFTLPLCQPGHHMDGDSLGMVSRHPSKAKFEKKYGTEAALLKRLQREVKV